MGNSNKKSTRPQMVFPSDIPVRSVDIQADIDYLLKDIARLDQMIAEPSRSKSGITVSEEEDVATPALTYSELSIERLMQLLSDRTDLDIDILDELSDRLKKFGTQSLVDFWNIYADLLITRHRNIPSGILNLELDRIPYDQRLPLLKKLGIVIYRQHPTDAMYLLSGDVRIAHHLLKTDPDKIKIATFVYSDNISTKRTKKAAFDARSKHQYGIAHLLFLKAADTKAAADIKTLLSK